MKLAPRQGGRAQGPALISTPVAGRPSTNTGGKTNPISKASRRSQGWLYTCIHSAKAANREADAWRIRNYSHDLDVDDPALQGEKETFIAWKESTTVGMLQSNAAL